MDISKRTERIIANPSHETIVAPRNKSSDRRHSNIKRMNVLTIFIAFGGENVSDVNRHCEDKCMPEKNSMILEDESLSIRSTTSYCASQNRVSFAKSNNY